MVEYETTHFRQLISNKISEYLVKHQETSMLL